MFFFFSEIAISNYLSALWIYMLVHFEYFSILGNYSKFWYFWSILSRYLWNPNTKCSTKDYPRRIMLIIPENRYNILILFNVCTLLTQNIIRIVNEPEKIICNFIVKISIILKFETKLFNLYLHTEKIKWYNKNIYKNNIMQVLL